MTGIKIDQVSGAARASHPALRAMDELMERIRCRAFDLFSGRGFSEGHPLEDWLAAEREICWPAAELAEQDREYVLSVALPGFEPGDIEVTATPGELIVHASRQGKEPAAAPPASKKESATKPGSERSGTKPVWSEFRSDDVYRRVTLERPLDPGKVTAMMKNGILQVTAPKAAEAARVVPISAAAA